MITLNILLDVLLDSDPYDGIDRLIREELATGQSTKQIHDEIFPLVKEARKTHGFTVDADEALLGALDALTGNCHPDCQYKDSMATQSAEVTIAKRSLRTASETLPNNAPIS